MDLTQIRARIDEVDGLLLRNLDDRARLTDLVSLHKGEELLPLRPAREAQVLRRLLAENTTCHPAMIVRVWREIISYSLHQQQPGLRIALLGDHLTVDLARGRFGSAWPLKRFKTATDVIKEAGEFGCVGVIDLDTMKKWDFSLPDGVVIFGFLPELRADGLPCSVCIGRLSLLPSGDDITFSTSPRLGRTPFHQMVLGLYAYEGWIDPATPGVIGIAPRPLS